jgi:hypothetical protein
MASLFSNSAPLARASARSWLPARLELLLAAEAGAHERLPVVRKGDAGTCFRQEQTHREAGCKATREASASQRRQPKEWLVRVLRDKGFTQGRLHVCCWNWSAGTHRGMLLALLIGVGLAVPAPASAAQLSLSWTDNSAGTATFKVERKSGAADAYAQIATIGVGVTSYVDASVTAGSTYCYRVRASNSGGDSPYSNEACGSPLGGFDLTVAKAGTGAGSVVSNPVGISCGADCFESYSPGTAVTLTTTPAKGSIFVGWTSGGCSGTDPCVMARNTPVTVTATFTRKHGRKP